jgi:hypothetical protein
MAGIKNDQQAAYLKDMYKYERIGETLKEVQYPKIYKVMNGATGSGDKFTQKLSAGQLERHTVEGQEISFTSPREGWTTRVKYHTYSAGLTFSYEAVKDTIKMANIVKDFAGTWGDEVAVAEENLAVRAFNNGGDLLGDFVFNGSYEGETDASGNMLYDSKPFFNLTGNTNTTKGGGTYYNSVASAYAAGAILPSHFSTLYALMTATNNRDELDRPTRNKPDTVVCNPGADYDSIWTILNSDQIANSTANDKNVHKGRIKNIVEWDYLDESAWYMGKANSDLMTFEKRQVPEMDFFEWKKTKGYLASIVCRFGVHFKPGCRRLWVRGGGTSA